MFIYTDDKDFDSQIKQLLLDIENEIEIQEFKKHMLINIMEMFCKKLKNISNLNISNELFEILTNLKIALDKTKENTINLNSLKIELNKSSKNVISNYNKLYKKLNPIILENTMFVETFLLKYISNSEYIIENYDEEKIVSDEDINIEELEDNNTLLISETKGKVFLPFTVSELKDRFSKTSSKYKNYQELIENEYILPISKFKNASISRFKEAYNLMKNKEHSSFIASFNLAIELSFNRFLHPAIITACKNIDELDIYLDYLSDNELDKFDIFKIEYEILPIKNRATK